ncbi:hypothetical protein [Bernardetia sp.]|uniref:hypothetical protein n=1 Tax=Bernardetia sp. TaxID=1937974 RepID=UPI0025BA58AA|nr:hypothetical protein [Bernardetia sp.]
MKTSNFSIRDFNSIFLTLSVCFLFLVSSCSSDKKESEKTNEEATITTENSTTNDTKTQEEDNSVALQEQQPNAIRPVYSDNEDERSTLISDDEMVYDTFSAQDSSEFFKRFAPKTQVFEIKNNDEQEIYCDLGTYIHIDSGTFVFADGSPVKEPVKFEVKEFYDKQTVLLSGLATNTKGGFLESGGMLHLEATSEGRKVKLQKDIDIEMPTFNTKTRNKKGMQVYLASNSSIANLTESVNLNDVNNPPSSWRSNGRAIEIKGIPAKRDFYNLVFLGKEDRIDEYQTNRNPCECADAKLVSEKIEALSSQVDVEKNRKYTNEFRSVAHRNKKREEKTPKYMSIYQQGKDTLSIEKSKSYQFSFYENPNTEDRIFRDTVQLAITIGKDGTAKVVEELKKTRYALDKTTIIRSINSSSGLRLSTTVSKTGACKGETVSFYIQSVGWKNLLEKGEEEFRSWKKTQRNSNEDYAISYKKRKQPILVWTGIIETTKRGFVEDYTMTRHLNNYLKTDNPQKQAAYDAYRQRCIDRYNKNVAKNASQLSARALDSYAFSVSGLGWINCDRFYGVPNSQKVDLLVNSKTPVRVIFNSINSVMEGSSNGIQNRFDNIPKGEEITIFGIRKKGEDLYMALHKTKVGKETVNITYEKVTVEEMQKALSFL